MSIFSFCLNSFYNNKNTGKTNIISHELIKEFREKYNIDDLTTSVQFTPLDNHCALNVLLLSHTNESTTKMRGDVLQNNPVKSILCIDSPNINALFHPEIKPSLSQIAKENKIQIKVIHSTSEPEIHIFGSIDAIEFARVEILVLLDRLSGLMIDTCPDIPQYLHNLISGRKHVQLQSIMEETSTNIYLQSPFSQICNKVEKSDGKIHLSSESRSSLTRAKELLCKLAAQKSKSMYHKDSNMDARKIDWILQNKRVELRKIMRDNGNNSISIYAENRINVERSIRLLNYLTSSIYEATFDLTHNDTATTNTFIHRAFDGSLEKFANILSQLSQSSGTDISFQSETNQLQLFGTERQVRNAHQLLCDMKFFKENHQFTRFSLELATDQREFISGKKNGKINKIMKSCEVNIRFSTSNEYNSCIHVESDSCMKCLDGLTLLQDELPAETSFYVPEIYHRRIIGVAGKNIQKVMKKYGVYVKFSGTEEFNAMGGYFENEDNVVARTPMKNQINLENLKHAVTEFISFQKDKEYGFTTVKVPSVLHRTIPQQSQSREVCRTNNAKIVWPERLGCDQVLIYGPQSQLSTVMMYMTQFVVLEHHISIAVKDDKMLHVLLEKEFIAGVQHSIKGATHMDLAVVYLNISNDELDQESQLEWIDCYEKSNETRDIVVFRFVYKLGQHQEQDFEKAIEIIQSAIASKDLPFQEIIAQRKEPKIMVPSSYTPHQRQKSRPNKAATMMDMNVLDIFSLPTTMIAATRTADHFEGLVVDNLDTMSVSPPLLPPDSNLFHPHDASFSSSSLLSAPQPTGKNIWASPRIQSSNIIPPMPAQMNYYHHLPPHSPPLPPHHPPCSQNSFNHHPQIKIQPSFSVPIIGGNTAATSTPQKPHHKSWPDVFFGGRDLFDTLPIRRASVTSAQQAFEFIPNSTSTSSSSTTTSSCNSSNNFVDQQQQQQQKANSDIMMNKYQNDLNHIVQQSPFIYSNAPPHFQYPLQHKMLLPAYQQPQMAPKYPQQQQQQQQLPKQLANNRPQGFNL